MWPYLPKQCDCSEDPTNPGTVCNHTGLTADNIAYTGPDLTCTGIVHGMPVKDVIQQLDYYLCSIEIAQHFLTYIQTHSQEFPEFTTLINGAIDCETILACGPTPPTTTTTTNPE